MKSVAPDRNSYQYINVTDHSVPIPGLTNGTKYYYAVFSTDSGGNTAVKEGNFVAGFSNCEEPPPPPPPGNEPPVLQSPIGDWIETRTPTFVWTILTGADKYEFKVLNSGGGNAYGPVTIMSGTACSNPLCSYTIPTNSPLADQSDYTWMLQAHIAAGNTWTAWSSAPFSVYTFVSVDLAVSGNPNTDDNKGLQRPQGEPCDGRTIPDTPPNKPSMRKNKGTIMVPDDDCNGDPQKPKTACTVNKPCQYIYFNVDEKFMSSDNEHQHPRVDLEIKFRDHKPVSEWADFFCLKYKKNDTNHTPVSKCASVGTSDTMKPITFSLTDAYFGDNVVNNDFRIECRTDANGNPTGDKDTRRWIDTVKVFKK